MFIHTYIYVYMCIYINININININIYIYIYIMLFCVAPSFDHAHHVKTSLNYDLPTHYTPAGQGLSPRSHNKECDIKLAKRSDKSWKAETTRSHITAELPSREPLQPDTSSTYTTRTQNASKTKKLILWEATPPSPHRRGETMMPMYQQ